MTLREGEPDLLMTAELTYRFEPSKRDPDRSVLRLASMKRVALGDSRIEDHPEIAASFKRQDEDLKYYPPIELDAEGRYVGFEPTHSGAESWAMKMRENWQARVGLWIGVALRVGETSNTLGEFARSKYGPLPTTVVVERLPDRDGRIRLRRTESIIPDITAEMLRTSLTTAGKREGLVDQLVDEWRNGAFEFELELKHQVELDPATLRPYRVERTKRDWSSTNGKIDEFEFVREEVWDWDRATDCP